MVKSMETPLSVHRSSKRLEFKADSKIRKPKIASAKDRRLAKRPVSTRSTFEALPTEIIEAIAWQSLNPNLFTVSRAIQSKLPDVQDFKVDVLILAFTVCEVFSDNLDLLPFQTHAAKHAPLPVTYTLEGLARLQHACLGYPMFTLEDFKQAGNYVQAAWIRNVWSIERTHIDDCDTAMKIMAGRADIFGREGAIRYGDSSHSLRFTLDGRIYVECAEDPCCKVLCPFRQNSVLAPTDISRGSSGRDPKRSTNVDIHHASPFINQGRSLLLFGLPCVPDHVLSLPTGPLKLKWLLLWFRTRHFEFGNKQENRYQNYSMFEDAVTDAVQKSDMNSVFLLVALFQSDLRWSRTKQRRFRSQCWKRLLKTLLPIACEKHDWLMMHTLSAGLWPRRDELSVALTLSADELEERYGRGDPKTIRSFLDLNMRRVRCLQKSSQRVAFSAAIDTYISDKMAESYSI